MKKTTADKVAEIFNRLGKKEMHVDEISQQLMQHYSFDYKDIEKTKNLVSNALSGNVKTKYPLFRKVKNKNKKSYKRGYYALKRKAIQTINVEEHIKSASKAYTGRSGEYAVISELIFHGYNATILPVDNGIDVVCSTGAKFFHIQVKTRICETVTDNISYTIKTSAFEKNNYYNDFYVFVRRFPQGMRWVSDYIVLHSRELNEAYQAAKLKKSSSIGVSFILVNHKIYLGSMDVSSSINNFDKIK